MIRSSAFFLILLTILGIISFFEIDDSITKNFREYHTEAILLCAIFASILIYEVLSKSANQLGVFLAEKIEARRFLDRVRKLSPSDKHVLSLFIDERRLTRELDSTEPSVAWLESIKLIHRGESTVDGRKVPFRISLYAMDYLSKNPNLLR